MDAYKIINIVLVIMISYSAGFLFGALWNQGRNDDREREVNREP
jgi:hypothetical protein